MNQEELSEAKECLKMHAELFAKFLNDKEIDRNTLYKQFAGQLRVLLCDNDLAVLTAYADEIGKELSIVVGTTSITENAPSSLTFTYDAYFCWWDYLYSGDTVLIRDYLEKIIGVIPVQDGDKSISVKYTPKEIIKWVANKDGVSHLNLKPPRVHKAMKNIVGYSGNKKYSNLIAQNLILQLAEWCYIAINYVFSDDSLYEFVEEESVNLIHIEPISLNKSTLLAWYFKDQKNGVYFEGITGFHIASMDKTLKELSFNTLLKIIPQLHTGNRSLLQLIEVGFEYNILIYLDESLNLQMQLKDMQYKLFNLKEYNVFNQFFNLSLEFDFLNENLSCYINGVNVVKTSFEVNNREFNVQEMFLAVSDKSTDALSCFTREVIFFNKVFDDKSRLELLKYHCDKVLS